MRRIALAHSFRPVSRQAAASRRRPVRRGTWRGMTIDSSAEISIQYRFKVLNDPCLTMAACLLV